MLYEQWREVVRAHGSDLAVWEPHRRWTFAELAKAAETFPADGPVLYPRGHSAEFILAVLAGWRDKRPVCPLESTQPAPALAGLPSNVAQVKLTSATTGPAKAILFSAEQMQADLRNIVATMGLRSEWPNLAFISLAHSYGFSNLVLPLLLQGIPLALLASPLPEALRQGTSLFPHVTLPAVPALWQAWHAAAAIPHNVRLAISAGAPLPLELESAIFDTARLKIHNFYGSSECGGIAYDATTQPRTDSGSVGTALKNVHLAINSAGCLEVRSAAVALGYWPEPDARLGNGIFATADLAEIEGGVVRLHGRASDLINVAGRKVAPERIERELMSHPAVSDCLVLGVPDSEAARGEFIAAVVVLRDATTEDVLRASLLERLPAWQLPRLWHFTQTIRRNERGKISRAEWRKMFTRV